MLRNKRKLAATARETKEYLRNNMLQNSTAPGITEDVVAQVSEEIEERATKNISVILEDKVQLFWCTVQVRRVSLEHTNTDILRNHSGNNPEH